MTIVDPKLASFVHPLRYEWLEATEANLAAAVEDGWAEVQRLKREQADLVERMAPLRERLAELRGPAKLPPRRYRTKIQETVALCGRCGSPVEPDGAA